MEDFLPHVRLKSALSNVVVEGFLHVPANHRFLGANWNSTNLSYPGGLTTKGYNVQFLKQTGHSESNPFAIPSAPISTAGIDGVTVRVFVDGALHSSMALFFADLTDHNEPEKLYVNLAQKLFGANWKYKISTISLSPVNIKRDSFNPGVNTMNDNIDKVVSDDQHSGSLVIMASHTEWLTRGASSSVNVSLKKVEQGSPTEKDKVAVKYVSSIPTDDPTGNS